MLDDILKIGIPSLIGLVTAFVSYSLGKRSKKYEILLEKSIPIAERVSTKLNTIHLVNEKLAEYYHKNFDHMESFEHAMDSFDRYITSLHNDVTNNIHELMQVRDALKAEIANSSLYLNHTLTNEIMRYLKLGDFTFADSELHSNFYEEFWRNLLDIENTKLRTLLYSDVNKYIAKILPK